MTEDTTDRDDIRWAPRVPKRKIKRLYEWESKGVLDEELIEDVGFSLLLRCRSILTIRDARDGRVTCPRCERADEATIISRVAHSGPDERIECPTCHWSLTWDEYRKTYQHKQLHSGGAVAAFETYVKAYTRARTPKAKILAIDRLIHEFHYSLREEPATPTRAAAVNLIQGKLTDVVRFLDELTYGEAASAELESGRREWRDTLDRQPWKVLPPRDADAPDMDAPDIDVPDIGDQ
jgi:hypothetical protein